MKIEENFDENLCARLFNFFHFSLSESEEEASENMIKFSAFIFGSRPPRKIAFEKRKIHLDWFSTLNDEFLRFSPRLTPNVVSAHSPGPFCASQPYRSTKAGSCFGKRAKRSERLLTSRELGSKNILHGLSFFETWARREKRCSLIFHYKRCVELTSWFYACCSDGGD